VEKIPVTLDNNSESLWNGRSSTMTQDWVLSYCLSIAPSRVLWPLTTFYSIPGSSGPHAVKSMSKVPQGRQIKPLQGWQVERVW
jgi:hypothetical protein